MNDSYDVPVLYLVFNRPEHTRRSFEAIRARRPSRLFIAADGPRPHVPTDVERTKEVQRITMGIDWPCEVMTLLRESNLGCAAAVSQAINWFFTHVESGVILEDDCIPSPVFWDYCALMLERYRDVPRVMCVSGNNFLPRALRPRTPYYFSRYPNIWGWATWARAWQAYAAVPLAPSHDDFAVGLRTAGIINPLSRWWWQRTLKKHVSPKSSAWGYRWTYSIWMRDGISISPNRNLVANVGFDSAATHVDGHRAPSRFGTVERWGIESVREFTPGLKVNRFADMVYDVCVITRRNVVGSALRQLRKPRLVAGRS